ncbi:hypothetical protein B0J18DRAFT_439951 [Chaetomium sp. MPI-SDFR-AT-0129]|nr:hypothetical protein B0J18DRAFT_439951 [Chaetomium sp. MPI-SDFR-AT-0129]
MKTSIILPSLPLAAAAFLARSAIATGTHHQHAHPQAANIAARGAEDTSINPRDQVQPPAPAHNPRAASPDSDSNSDSDSDGENSHVKQRAGTQAKKAKLVRGGFGSSSGGSNTGTGHGGGVAVVPWVYPIGYTGSSRGGGRGSGS